MKKNPQLKKKKKQAIQNFKPRPMTSRIPPERVKLINIIRKMTIQRANAQIQKQKRQMKNQKRNSKKGMSTNFQKVQQRSKDNKRKDSKSKKMQIDSLEKSEKSSIQSNQKKVQRIEQVHMSKGLKRNMILRKNLQIQSETKDNSKKKQIEETQSKTRKYPLMQIQGQNQSENHIKDQNKSRVRFVQHKNQVYVSETMYQYVGDDNVQISAYVQPSAKELDRLIKLNKAGKESKLKKVIKEKQVKLAQRPRQVPQTRSLRGSNPFVRHVEQEDECFIKENEQGEKQDDQREENEEQEDQNEYEAEIKELELQDSFIYDHLEENLEKERQTILIETSPRGKSADKNQEKTQSHKKQCGSGKSFRKSEQEKVFSSKKKQIQENQQNQQLKMAENSQNEFLFKKQFPKIHVHKIIQVEKFDYQNRDQEHQLPNGIKQREGDSNKEFGLSDRCSIIQEGQLILAERNDLDLNFTEKIVRRSKRLSQKSKSQEKIDQIALGTKETYQSKAFKHKSQQQTPSDKHQPIEGTPNISSIQQTVKSGAHWQNPFSQKQNQLLSSNQEIQLMNQSYEDQEDKKQSKSTSKNQKK